MIIGIGTDICEVARIQKVLEKSAEQFLSRIFVDEERLENMSDNPHHVARRYAAKEAVAKALGTGIGEDLSFQDIMIEREGNTRPMVKILKEEFSNIHIHLSISDEKAYAVAFAIAERMS